MMRLLFLGFISFFLVACASNPPAPVIERAPQASKPSAVPSNSGPTKPSVTQPAEVKPALGKDWRPDSYTVKKGDTLFSIGLEFGYDYKEIAAANNIVAPYLISIGQKLSFTSLNSSLTAKNGAAENKPITEENEDGVIISPIKTNPTIASTSTEIKSAESPVASAVTPVLTEPKAMREPYSLEALNRKPTEAKPVTANLPEIKPADTKPIDTKPSDEENLNWAWPTQGKIIANFNEATNKGVDIAGSLGQTVSAAASGRVIYVGSDLRGYGKLVIVKHNKTFLSVYAHNNKIVAKEGQTVVAGQKIAEMGNTDANSVKLHFEIRRQGKSVDPAKYLPQN